MPKTMEAMALPAMVPQLICTRGEQKWTGTTSHGTAAPAIAPPAHNKPHKSVRGS
jgi:hypothetical protein